MTARAARAAARAEAARREFDYAAQRFRSLDLPRNFKVEDLEDELKFKYLARLEMLRSSNRKLKAAESGLRTIPARERRGPGAGGSAPGAARSGKAAPRKNPAKKRAPSKFQQIVEARLDEAGHVLQGQGGRTGRVKRNDEGDAIGRFRGYARAIPELASIAAPARIVDAISKRRGALYQQIRWAVENWALKHFPEAAPRQRGLVAGPHRGNRKCKTCLVPHSGTAHRSHGPDAFKGRREPVATWMRAGGELRAPEELPDWVTNPRRRLTEIYPASRGIVISGMRKGPGHPCDARCRAIGHRFRHKFPEGIEILGDADGTVLLRQSRAG